MAGPAAQERYKARFGEKPQRRPARSE